MSLNHLLLQLVLPKRAVPLSFTHHPSWMIEWGSEWVKGMHVCARFKRDNRHKIVCICTWLSVSQEFWSQYWVYTMLYHRDRQELNNKIFIILFRHVQLSNFLPFLQPVSLKSVSTSNFMSWLYIPCIHQRWYFCTLLYFNIHSPLSSHCEPPLTISRNIDTL